MLSHQERQQIRHEIGSVNNEIERIKGEIDQIKDELQSGYQEMQGLREDQRYHIRESKKAHMRFDGYQGGHIDAAIGGLYQAMEKLKSRKNALFQQKNELHERKSQLHARLNS